MAKKNRFNREVPVVDPEPVVPVTAAEAKLEEAETVVPIVKPQEVDKEDLKIIANQCYHNNQACQIGTYSSTLAKYAVFYRNRWFFVVYNRYENKASTLLKYNMLKSDEAGRFQLYKNRLENEQRIQRMKDYNKGE